MPRGQPSRTAHRSSSFADGAIAPNDVAVDAHGRIWVADTNNLRIQAFTPDGTPLGQIKLPGFDFAAAPSSVTSTATSSYVTRFTNPDILVFRILPPDD